MNEAGEAGDFGEAGDAGGTGGIGEAAETGKADEERNRISRASPASPASDTTVHLADVQRMLALFTQGLGGRYLHLVPNDAEQDGGATATAPGIDLAGLRRYASAGRDAAAPAAAPAAVTDRIELPPASRRSRARTTTCALTGSRSCTSSVMTKQVHSISA